MNARAGHVNLFFLPFPPLTFDCTINTIDTRVAKPNCITHLLFDRWNEKEETLYYLAIIFFWLA